ncbi:MAG: ATP-binding protein, partial [Acidobacteria bacterium]|nr:ATP-binding protein [Acidobacteriota bacterium]
MRMRIQIGDTVVLIDRQNEIGIVEKRQGDEMTIRFPDYDNKRERYRRNEIRPLAEIMFEARRRGVTYRHSLSLTGRSTLAELVSEFGYSTQQLRGESLDKVVRQLQRAGLEVHPETDRWGRDDRFKLTLATQVSVDPPESSETAPKSPNLHSVTLPEPFWPTALGLDPNRELLFLRALIESAPILCILLAPDDAVMQGWIQATWEGLTAWAFQAAQRFRPHAYNGSSAPAVRIGSSAILQAYLEASVLNSEAPTLLDQPHSLNLITLKSESELPVDFQRLQAVWRGPIFNFTPEPSKSSDGQMSEDVRALLALFLLLGGSTEEVKENLCPLRTFL